jgi:hypothetical protein
MCTSELMASFNKDIDCTNTTTTVYSDSIVTITVVSTIMIKVFEKKIIDQYI